MGVMALSEISASSATGDAMLLGSFSYPAVERAGLPERRMLDDDAAIVCCAERKEEQAKTDVSRLDCCPLPILTRCSGHQRCSDERSILVTRRSTMMLASLTAAAPAHRSTAASISNPMAAHGFHLRITRAVHSDVLRDARARCKRERSTAVQRGRAGRKLPSASRQPPGQSTDLVDTVVLVLSDVVAPRSLAEACVSSQSASQPRTTNATSRGQTHPGSGGTRRLHQQGGGRRRDPGGSAVDCAMPGPGVLDSRERVKGPPLPPESRRATGPTPLQRQTDQPADRQRTDAGGGSNHTRHRAAR